MRRLRCRRHDLRLVLVLAGLSEAFAFVPRGCENFRHCRSRSSSIGSRSSSSSSSRRTRAWRKYSRFCDIDEDPDCRYDGTRIDNRFADEPLAAASRVGQILAAGIRTALAGDDGGATLRAELAALGPVFCKVGQTLATRPDIVGP